MLFQLILVNAFTKLVTSVLGDPFENFPQHLQKFANERFNNAAEKDKRKKIFIDNLQEIFLLSSKTKGFEVSSNKFSFFTK